MHFDTYLLVTILVKKIGRRNGTSSLLVVVVVVTSPILLFFLVLGFLFFGGSLLALPLKRQGAIVFKFIVE